MTLDDLGWTRDGPGWARFKPVGARFEPVGVRFKPVGAGAKPVGARFKPVGPIGLKRASRCTWAGHHFLSLFKPIGVYPLLPIGGDRLLRDKEYPLLPIGGTDY